MAQMCPNERIELVKLIRNGEGGWVKFHFCKIFFDLGFGFEDMLPGLALSCDLDGRPTLINRLPFQ